MPIRSAWFVCAAGGSAGDDWIGSLRVPAAGDAALGGRAQGAVQQRLERHHLRVTAAMAATGATIGVMRWPQDDRNAIRKKRYHSTVSTNTLPFHFLPQLHCIHATNISLPHNIVYVTR